VGCVRSAEHASASIQLRDRKIEGMRTIKTLVRQTKTRLIETVSDVLLSSGHFRRTMLRKLFQNHVSSSALAYVAYPDHVLIVDPRDHMIAFSLVSGKTWQRSEFNRAIEVASEAGALVPGGWFIDVGANIGTQTLYALLSGKFRGAIAIEPEPRNAALLRRNIELNGFTDRVHVIEAAASAQSGMASLNRDGENHGAHSIEPGLPLHKSDTISVPTRTIDDILAGLRISPADIGLVMIDVEGHEIGVMKGMASLRKRGVPLVAEVIGEVHGDSGIAELRALLASDYRSVSPLRTHASQVKTAPESRLAEFDFGLRQCDVLIYNAQKP
jgi:FkbM family methyltransferase